MTVVAMAVVGDSGGDWEWAKRASEGEGVTGGSGVRGAGVSNGGGVRARALNYR